MLKSIIIFLFQEQWCRSIRASSLFWRYSRLLSLMSKTFDSSRRWMKARLRKSTSRNVHQNPLISWRISYFLALQRTKGKHFARWFTEVTSLLSGISKRYDGATEWQSHSLVSRRASKLFRMLLSIWLKLFCTAVCKKKKHIDITSVLLDCSPEIICQRIYFRKQKLATFI